MKKIFFLIVFLLSTQIIQTTTYLKFTHPHEVFDIVRAYLPLDPIIVEAGAYDGADSLLMLQKWPHATIHSFEPVPELYNLLQQTTKNYTSIHTYQLAVGDFIGNASMCVSEYAYNPGFPSQSSSLLEPKEHLRYSPVKFPKKISVPVTTFDEWAVQNNIDHVDFMWLDMQGYELNALMASPKIVSTVKAILTEIEFVEAYQGQYLFDDVKKWLESQGFIMIAINDSYGWFGDALFIKKRTPLFDK